MTALHIPDDGCCCAEDLAAVTQACVDHLVGFAALVAGDMFDPTLATATRVQEAICGILQAALTDYAENHGAPDPMHDSLAFSHVVMAMRG